ncbi:unnamed protein product, partial (mitochondrion) [Musa hybrid cultivar]
ICVKFILFLGENAHAFVRSISLFIHESYACNNSENILSFPIIDQSCCAP